jgi:hypothetical protein
MLSKLCPRHGEVTGQGTRCPLAGCNLPLLRLESGEDKPAVLKWEYCDIKEKADGADLTCIALNLDE